MFLRIILIIVFFSSFAFAEKIEFEIPTIDTISKISGQIDRPNCGVPPYPVVVMVGGTGLFTRDVFFGKSGTEADFVFKHLSGMLNQLCIATVRFDYRGVKCDAKSPKSYPDCIDQNLRQKVTDQTILEDIQVVYDFSKMQSYLDSNRTVLFGHSEGALNISRLVAQGSISAKAIMFLGGLTESAAGILRWQIAERPAELMMSMDSDRNDILTNEEIKESYPNSFIKNIYPLNSLLSASGSITKDEVVKAFYEIYESTKVETLKKSDDQAFISGGITFSAYKWWKRWFLDETSVLENLKDFSGPIEYHNGDIDSQTPGRRQKEFLLNSNVKMKSKPNFIIHAGKGHGLSNDPLFGPLDPSAAEMIVQQISNWVD